MAALSAVVVPGVEGTLVAVLPNHARQARALPSILVTHTLAASAAQAAGASFVTHALWKTHTHTHAHTAM